MVCERCWLVQTLDFAQADEFFSSEYAYFSSFSTTCIGTPRDAIPEANVRRKSWSVQCAITHFASNACLHFGHPLNEVVGLPRTFVRLAGNTYSLVRGTRSRIAATIDPKGNVCARLFFVIEAGSVIV